MVIAVRVVKTSNLGAQGPALDINGSLKLTKFEQNYHHWNTRTESLQFFWS